MVELLTFIFLLIEIAIIILVVVTVFRLNARFPKLDKMMADVEEGLGYLEIIRQHFNLPEPPRRPKPDPLAHIPPQHRTGANK